MTVMTWRLWAREKLQLQVDVLELTRWMNYCCYSLLKLTLMVEVTLTVKFTAAAAALVQLGTGSESSTRSFTHLCSDSEH